ncbi:hypothetical protein C8Q74DRAFT_292375 [Fomes fomentarius]|nr:hypothetical protein C8Q74DRAFT_292375 [Fomes fomentarius]
MPRPLTFLTPWCRTSLPHLMYLLITAVLSDDRSSRSSTLISFWSHHLLIIHARFVCLRASFVSETRYPMYVVVGIVS